MKKNSAIFFLRIPVSKYTPLYIEYNIRNLLTQLE